MHGLEQVVVALWFLPLTIFLVLPTIIAGVAKFIIAFNCLVPLEGRKIKYAASAVGADR